METNDTPTPEKIIVDGIEYEVVDRNGVDKKLGSYHIYLMKDGEKYHGIQYRSGNVSPLTKI